MLLKSIRISTAHPHPSPFFCWLTIANTVLPSLLKPTHLSKSYFAIERMEGKARSIMHWMWRLTSYAQHRLLIVFLKQATTNMAEWALHWPHFICIPFYKWLGRETLSKNSSGTIVPTSRSKNQRKICEILIISSQLDACWKGVEVRFSNFFFFKVQASNLSRLR